MSGPARQRDAILYRSKDADRKSLSALINLITNAVSYGMAMGTMRTGLGTDNPFGRKTPGESLYYRALEAYSAFDWDVQTRLLAPDAARELPRDLAVLAGRFDERFIATLQDEAIDEIELGQRALRTLAPKLDPFAFRRLEQDDPSFQKERGELEYSDTIREELWRGSKAKLDAIRNIAYSTEHKDLQERLSTMASAFAPLSTSFAAYFDERDPTKSFTRLVVYLPAFHTLVADNSEAPDTWYLKRGIARTALPSPVQVSAASISHFAYLVGDEPDRDPGLRFEIRRDFSEPQTVTMIIGFGHFTGETAEPELFGFDSNDQRDALALSLKAKLPPHIDDSVNIRAAKENFNNAMGGFDIEARVHRLTLHLKRDDVSKHADREQVLRPRFSLEGSRISFSVERYTENPTELISLRAAGFDCEPDPDGLGHTCRRDFYSWERLREFFSADVFGDQGWGGVFAAGREKLLSQMIGLATQRVLDLSIQSIESALDQEIARVVSEYLERYAKARDIVTGRLHDKLFR